MYKVVTKEDTIRIPAEYIRKDKSLNEHIDRLAASAFEGRFDDNNRFVLVTSNWQKKHRRPLFLAPTQTPITIATMR